MFWWHTKRRIEWCCFVNDGVTWRARRNMNLRMCNSIDEKIASRLWLLWHFQFSKTDTIMDSACWTNHGTIWSNHPHHPNCWPVKNSRPINSANWCSVPNRKCAHTCHHAVVYGVEVIAKVVAPNICRGPMAQNVNRIIGVSGANVFHGIGWHWRKSMAAGDHGDRKLFSL